jgi:hypothetical protein
MFAAVMHAVDGHKALENKKGANHPLIEGSTSTHTAVDRQRSTRASSAGYFTPQTVTASSAANRSFNSIVLCAIVNKCCLEDVEVCRFLQKVISGTYRQLRPDATNTR